MTNDQAKDVALLRECYDYLVSRPLKDHDLPKAIPLILELRNKVAPEDVPQEITIPPFELLKWK